MSINDCLRNIAAGNPAHGPDISEPKRSKGTILTQAYDVYKDLAIGRGTAEFAQKCEDPMSLVIGAMLAKMNLGGMIREPDQVIDLLNGVFLGKSLSSIDPNRRTIIEALKNLGFLPSDINVRVAKPVGSTPTLEEISVIIEFHTGITLKQIISATRVREVVKARFLVIWIMRNECGHSLTAIGGRLGGRDHATICHGMRRVKEDRDADMGKRLLIDSVGDQSDMLALKRIRSHLTASSRFLQNGQAGGMR